MLLERSAQVPLEQLLDTRLFEPLGMADTAFSFPARSAGRVATAYAPDERGAPVVFDRPDGFWAQPPRFPDAAGWLCSTLDDFWAFVQVLLSGGIAGGRRLLSPESVVAMTSDHLTADQRRDADLFLGGSGWGYGMSTPPADRGVERIPGFGWDGGTGTAWRTDPSTGLSGILFTQRQLISPEPPPVFVDFWAAARAALV